MTIELNPTEIKVLRFLSNGHKYPNPSVIGYEVLKTEKRNASPQGMALAIGRFLSSLRKKKLIDEYHGYQITTAGIEALREHDAKAAA